MNTGGVLLLWVVLSSLLVAGRMVTGLDALLVPICQIQGSGFTSPLDGVSVQVLGVVSADFDDSSTKGFFMQAAN